MPFEAYTKRKLAQPPARGLPKHIIRTRYPVPCLEEMARFKVLASSMVVFNGLINHGYAFVGSPVPLGRALLSTSRTREVRSQTNGYN